MFYDILRNAAEEHFAGAVVIVPPQGDKIEMLFLNPSPNAAVFWSTIKTLVDIEIGKLEDAERSKNSWR